MYDVQVFWSLPEDPAGNTAHVAEHGLTPEEVEDVLLDPEIAEVRSHTTNRPCKFGWTATGRYIGVIFEKEEIDGLRIVIPVTAFDAPPPRQG